MRQLWHGNPPSLGPGQPPSQASSSHVWHLSFVVVFVDLREFGRQQQQDEVQDEVQDEAPHGFSVD